MNVHEKTENDFKKFRVTLHPIEVDRTLPLYFGAATFANILRVTLHPIELCLCEALFANIFTLKTINHF